MGDPRTADGRRAPAACGRARETVAQQPGGAQRHLVDPADRRAMGGLARAVSALSDLPSALPTLGGRWHARTGVGGVGDRPQRPGRPRPLGVFHRRHVYRGEKRGGCVGATKRGKGTKLLAMADRAGLPLAICAASATPHEVTLVAATLDSRFVDDLPERLIGDRAYDADPLDQALAQLGIEMIAPHRRGRKKPKTQDGRPLRRYRRRWKIERLFAWLGNFRRLVVRYERSALNYLGFVQLGCILILLRQSL